MFNRISGDLRVERTSNAPNLEQVIRDVVGGGQDW
jgi:hypothetical protein